MQLPPQNKTTKYEHVIPQIVAIEQNPNIEGLLVILNTVGGDVEAGLAIAEMLASFVKADSLDCAWRGSFNRGADCCLLRSFLYSRDSDDDDSSHPFNRSRHWRAANF